MKIRVDPAEDLKGKAHSKDSPSSPIWKQYTQGYDLPNSRGGIVIEEIPCPICADFPFPEHNATVEDHWIGGMGYIRHICCDRTGTWLREL